MADPIREALERLLAVIKPKYTDPDEIVAVVRAMAAARAALAAEPPAPAPALPLDLDALLSPEGAYEPGTGQEDGAQLVDLCWWAPMHGCDTLENLLDRIRRRILPHLRPPIAGIDVPGTDGDYGGLQELCDAEGVDVRIGAPLLKRAREAWGAAQPPAPVPGWQPMDTAPQDGTEILASDYDALEIVSWSWDAWETGSGWFDRNGQRLFPAWWQPLPDHPPIPQPPQGGEVGR